MAFLGAAAALVAGAGAALAGAALAAVAALPFAGAGAALPLSAGTTTGDIALSRKCILGNGTRFVVTSLMSTFREPSKRIPDVRFRSKFAAMPFIPSQGVPPCPATSPPSTPLSADPLRDPAPVLFSMLATRSISAWFSTGMTQSACSASAAHDSIALYGDVTTSSSSDGNTETEKR